MNRVYQGVAFARLLLAGIRSLGARRGSGTSVVSTGGCQGRTDNGHYDAINKLGRLVDGLLGFLVTAVVGTIASFIFRVWFRVEVTGHERFRALEWARQHGRGGFIIASNHKTHLDSYHFVTIFNFPQVLMEWLSAKQNPLPYHAGRARHHHSTPIKAFMSRHFHTLPVCDGQEASVVRPLLRVLPTHAVHLFPGGTREKDAASTEAKAGVGLLAVKAQVPVLPIYVEGMEQVQDPNAGSAGLFSIRWHNFGCRVRVRVGEPERFSSERRDYQAVAQEILDAVLALRP